MSHKQLSEAIIARSVSTRWDEAKLEWHLASVYYADEPETCLCGHFPIVELCVLTNRRNGCEAVVGNHCVKKFMGLPSDKIFVALKRIQRSREAPLNPEAIAYAHQRGWINDWERSFYFDTWRKRELSDRQNSVRVKINEMVLGRVARDTRRVRKPLPTRRS